LKRRFIVWALIAGLVSAAVVVLLRPGRRAAVSPLAAAPANPTAGTVAPPTRAAAAPQSTNSSPAPDVLNPQPSTLNPQSSPTAGFDAFSGWVNLFTNGSASLVEGQRLAWKRREAMLDLIQTDPAKAIELSAPFAWHRDLPREITRFFEKQVDGRGEFNVAVATDFAHGQSTVFRSAQIGGTNYQAFVYGRRLTESSKTGIPLHGIALDGKMAVASEPLRRLAPEEAAALQKSNPQPSTLNSEQVCSVCGRPADWRGRAVYGESGGGVLCFCGMDHFDLVNRQWVLAESGTGGFGGSGVAGSGGSGDDAWTHGPKTVLYMRVNFPDDLTEPISEANAYAVMDNVNAFYVEDSYNQTSLDPTVAPLVTLPQIKAWYATAGTGQLQADAREATRLAGYDTANYDLDIVCFNSVPGPKYSFWSGLASVGGKGLWLQGNLGGSSPGVAAHELGHNYGLWHANYWDTTANASMIGPGTNLEYGNIYDTMGLAGAGMYQFNAASKNKLDWLKAGAVQLIATNGVYRLYPFDVPDWSRVAGRTYAAAVQKDFARYYWLEFRRLFAGNPWTQSGVLLNWSPWQDSGGGTQLIDTTPGSPTGSGDSRDDAALVVGRTFNDNSAGVHVTTLARGANGAADPWLDVQVKLGTFPDNQPPELRVEVDLTNIAPGALVHFHAQASDPDGDTLAYAWSFDDLSFSSNNLPWTSKTFSTPGDHVVRCVVSDMKGGEASANAVVTVGGPGGHRITGRVTDTNGVPLEGVLVSNGSNSIALFRGGWTDSDGRYVIVNATTNLTLNAVQFGHMFVAATNWSSPVSPTNDMANADFFGLPLPAISIIADTNSVAENDGTTHFFTVTRTGSTDDYLTAQFFLSGTATPGSDFILDPAPDPTHTITIPAGTNRVTFAFQALNDSSVEGRETATLTLLDDPNYGQPSYALAPPAGATLTILDDDSTVKPVVTVTTPTPEIAEKGMDNGQLVFARSGSSTGDLFVNYSLGGTASNGVDYATLPGVVLIPAGQGSATVPLQVMDDKNVEPDKAVVVAILPNAAYATGNPASATITIQDDDFMTVTVFPTDESVAEPSSPGAFTVKRDGDLTEGLVVHYRVGGTAGNGVDDVALGGTVTIPAGATSTGIALTPLDDTLLEGDESVIVTLTNDINYDVGTPGSATIFIHDNEKPALAIIALTNSVSEQGDTIGQFQISRNSTGGDLTVYLAVSGTALSGIDYLPLDNPVVIPNGSSSVTLDVIPFHDLILEPAENVVLALQPNANYNVGSPGTARVEILDDRTSQVPGAGFCSAASTVVESESPGIAVALSVSWPGPVTVDYQVIGGTAPANRYSLPAGTLTFVPGNQVAFIPLQIVNDAVVEPPQTVKVVLFNPANATLDGIKVHTYTILDDDACSVSVTATVTNASESGPVAGNFRITRAGSTIASQAVNFQVTGTASAPGDYAPLGTSATIPAGAAFVDLPVTPTDDHTPEFPQTVVLTLTSATNAAIVSPSVATVTISNNDTNNLPVVTVTSTIHPFAVEGGGNGEFLFTRNGPTTNALAVLFTVSGTATNGPDYAALTNGVTIPAGQSSVVVPVVPVDDALIEGDETITLALTEVETYRVAYPGLAALTIQDNDQSVWVDASDFAASKYGPDSGAFTFSRFGTTNAAVTIYFTISGTASNGLDYAAIPNSIAIPAGAATAALTILPLHNGIVKGPVTATLTLQPDPAYTPGAPASGTVTIDDDMPMLAVSAPVAEVLEGSGSNGVFRLTRTGDPKYDFMAFFAVGGTATSGVDYPPLATNVFFDCGVTAIDLFVTPTNEPAVEGDETVTVALLPDPAYTILSPSNAALTITDAGTNQTPVVVISSPESPVVFLDFTNAGLALHATVTDDNPSNTLTWSKVSGPDALAFADTSAADTTVVFTNSGIYQLRVTADDGLFQGHADLLVFVRVEALSATNILHWSLDEGGGTNVTDSSGSGRDGVFAGSPVWTTNGALAGALQFSGTNDCVRQSAGSNGLNGLKAFTISLWVKPPPAAASEGFLTADDAETNLAFNLATRNIASCGAGTNVVEAVFTTTRGAAHRASRSGALPPDQWRNLALTWTSGEAPRLYLDGQLDQPGSSFVPVSGALTNCPQFIVGKGAFDSPASWSGALDDVRVFAGALSPDEILGLAGGAIKNHAPVVDAGANVTVQLNFPLQLTGAVTDDGLPNPPGRVTNVWTYLGTNDVTIPDPARLTNTLVFTSAGDYSFRLTASDGEATTFADVTVTAVEPAYVYLYTDGPDASELGPHAGDFYLLRDIGTNALTVYLAVSGTASNGVDYAALPKVVTFAANSYDTNISVAPFLDDRIEGDESVTLTIVSNLAYSIYDNFGQATVTVHDSPYGLWSIQQFTIEQLTVPDLSGPAADFDHDGVRNFVEYAFDRNPQLADLNPPYAWGFEQDTNDGLAHLTLTYTRWLPPRDVEYGAYVSSDLLTWNTGTNYVEEFLHTNNLDGITETVKTRARAPFPGSTNQFMNLRVWLQQVPGP
jgi:hypothetical protein